MLLRILLLLIALGASFLYIMGNPRPKEPDFLTKIRMTSFGEYLGHLAHGLFNPRLIRPGATPKEVKEALPGDELLHDPDWQSTRATTIYASRNHVWPWLVQMGSGRAGYYAWFPLSSREAYKNSTHSTREILPQFQAIQVGDIWLDGPDCTPERGAWTVRAIEPERSLVLFAARDLGGGPDFKPDGPKPAGFWFICSWAFVLHELDNQTTRLIVRARADFGSPRWMRPIARLVLGVGDTVMERSMLEAIKERAEQLKPERETAMVS